MSRNASLGKLSARMFLAECCQQECFTTNVVSRNVSLGMLLAGMFPKESCQQEITIAHEREISDPEQLVTKNFRQLDGIGSL